MYDEDPTMDLPADLFDAGQFRARHRGSGAEVTAGPVPWPLTLPGDRAFLLVETDGRELAVPKGWTLERDELAGDRRRFVFGCRVRSTATPPPVELGAPFLAAQIQAGFVGMH